MKFRVVLRPSAEADLNSLYEYIALDSPKNAIEFTRRIREQCARLALFPERGTRRDDLHQGARIIGFERRVVIVFHVMQGEVEVMRILYAGRRLEHAFEEEPSR